MKQGKILIVDDEPQVRRLLRRGLEDDGLVAIEAATEADAEAALRQGDVALITLDLHLGNDDGLAFARRIRRTNSVPIIMVTGKNDVIDRVVGLEIGADDYITKPFHVREVLARIRAILRRAETGGHTASDPAQTNTAADKVVTVTFDGLVARFDHFELLGRDGEPLDLTNGEFKLLSAFLQNPKRVLTRDLLMNLLNGVDWSPLDRTIDNQVARLRRKIERDPGVPRLIKTIRGKGYMFVAEVTSA